MGAYTWLNDREFEAYSHVADADIEEAIQEVRSVMPEWYIQEQLNTYKSFWYKTITTKTYTVYNKQKEDYNEVRIQLSASTKAQVLNLLYGLYMGYYTALNMKQHEKTT